MSDIGDILNELATDILPEVFAAAMPDTCSVVEKSESQGSDGGLIPTWSDAYTNIPCSYEPQRSSTTRRIVGDKQVSVQMYKIEMPTHTAAGARIDLDPTIHRIEVQARGNEPEKTFLVEAVRDDSGCVFEVVCTKLN